MEVLIQPSDRAQPRQRNSMQDQQNQIRNQHKGQPRYSERQGSCRLVKTFRPLGPHHDLSVVWSGATPSRALGRTGRHPIPRCAAQLVSQSEVTPPAPVRVEYWARGFHFMAATALIWIAAKY